MYTWVRLQKQTINHLNTNADCMVFIDQSAAGARTSTALRIGTCAQYRRQEQMIARFVLLRAIYDFSMLADGRPDRAQ